MTSRDLTVTSRTVSDMSIDTTTTSFSVSPEVSEEHKDDNQVVIAPRQRNMWWAIPMFTIVWLITGAIIISSLVRVDYWEVAPGSAEQVSPRLSLDNDALQLADRFRPKSPVLFVTAYGSKLSALDALLGTLDPDVDVLNRVQKFGTATPDQQTTVGFKAMITAKQIAEYVALRRLGYEASISYGELIIDRFV